jgi:hypothetical protein
VTITPRSLKLRSGNCSRNAQQGYVVRDANKQALAYLGRGSGVQVASRHGPGPPSAGLRAAMRFRLTYEGEIRPRPSAGLPDIHAIRQRLHPQLKRLWEHAPLSDLKDKWLRDRDPMNPDAFYARITAVGPKKYAPIVATHLGAELDIIFLRQQAKGQLIGEGGDIDNRLKTLFDALRMPSKGEVQQLGDVVAQDEDPLHCLLEDDALIHRVNVETDRLLKDADPRTLMALIQVTVVVTKVTLSTVTLA